MRWAVGQYALASQRSVVVVRESQSGVTTEQELWCTVYMHMQLSVGADDPVDVFPVGTCTKVQFQILLAKLTWRFLPAMPPTTVSGKVMRAQMTRITQMVPKGKAAVEW